MTALVMLFLFILAAIVGLAPYFAIIKLFSINRSLIAILEELRKANRPKP